jgi:hypothetical protein
MHVQRQPVPCDQQLYDWPDLAGLGKHDDPPPLGRSTRDRIGDHMRPGPPT